MVDLCIGVIAQEFFYLYIIIKKIPPQKNKYDPHKIFFVKKECKKERINYTNFSSLSF